MSLDLINVYRLQSASRQEFSCRDRDLFGKLKKKKEVAMVFEGGRDTISVAIYFIFKLFYFNLI